MLTIYVVTLMLCSSLSEPRFATVQALRRFLPGTDPNSKQPQNFATWWSDRRTALCWQFSLACVVFVVNLGWTVWAMRKYPSFNGIGVSLLPRRLSYTQRPTSPQNSKLSIALRADLRQKLCI